MDHDHLNDFRDKGFAIVRGVFGSAEVAEMAAAFERIYAQGLEHGCSYRHQNVYFHVAEDSNLGRVVRMVQWPSYFDPVLERFRRDPRMLEILQLLIGGNLKQIINQLHWKPPASAMVEFAFHQDARFRRPREAYHDIENSYVQTDIAIDPHRRGNGADTV